MWSRVANFLDFFGQGQHCYLLCVTKINNLTSRFSFFRIHRLNNSFNHIVYITKASSLAAISVNGQRLFPQSLGNKVWNCPSIHCSHSWPISVEDSSNNHFSPVHS